MLLINHPKCRDLKHSHLLFLSFRMWGLSEQLSCAISAQGLSCGCSWMTAQAGDNARHLLLLVWCQGWKHSQGGGWTIGSPGISFHVYVSLHGISLQHSMFRVADLLTCWLRLPRNISHGNRRPGQKSCHLSNLAQRSLSTTCTISHSLEVSL
jgi:hypothetical protein